MKCRTGWMLSLALGLMAFVGCNNCGNRCNSCGCRPGPVGWQRGGTDYQSNLNHHAYRWQGAGSGVPSAAVAYPYYTTRGPRDFLVNNPPTIGR
jgi:hypothetical protein